SSSTNRCSTSPAKGQASRSGYLPLSKRLPESVPNYIDRVLDCAYNLILLCINTDSPVQKIVGLNTNTNCLPQWFAQDVFSEPQHRRRRALILPGYPARMNFQLSRGILLAVVFAFAAVMARAEN